MNLEDIYKNLINLSDQIINIKDIEAFRKENLDNEYILQQLLKLKRNTLNTAILILMVILNNKPAE